MILSNIKNNLNSKLSLNLIFAFFPVSFVLGNFVTNLNLILFCIYGIWHSRSKILTFKFNLALKIVFIFFLIVFFSTVLSFAKSLYFQEHDATIFDRLIKSILFFRYFLFLLVIYYLSYNDIINFKYFFISAAVVTLFITVDVIFQYTFGYNFFGFKSFHQ